MGHLLPVGPACERTLLPCELQQQSEELHHVILPSSFGSLVLPNMLCRHMCGCCSARRKTGISTFSDLFLISVLYAISQSLFCLNLELLADYFRHQRER